MPNASLLHELEQRNLLDLAHKGVDLNLMRFQELQAPGHVSNDSVMLLGILGGAACSGLSSLQHLALHDISLTLVAMRALGQMFQQLAGSVTVLCVEFNSVPSDNNGALRSDLLQCHFE